MKLSSVNGYLDRNKILTWDFLLIWDLSGPKKQLPEPRLPSWGRVRTAAFNSPFAPLARVFQRRIEIISLSRPDILCFQLYEKSKQLEGADSPARLTGR